MTADALKTHQADENRIAVTVNISDEH